METVSDTRRLVLVVALLVALLMGAQALAVSAAPKGELSTGRVLGRTGFAYLGGLRTFAAAVIWNRIDPQFHEYFGGVSLKEQTFMVPKMRIVTMLDPSFTQAYYISSFIVFMHVGQEEGIAVAREGLKANPRSGELLANLSQLLFIQDKKRNRNEIVACIKAALGPQTEWQDAEAAFEGYATMKATLEGLGKKKVAALLGSQLDAWRARGVGLGDHDHDGDGKQDH